jgi:hypothetical protein
MPPLIDQIHRYTTESEMAPTYRSHSLRHHVGDRI